MRRAGSALVACSVSASARSLSMGSSDDDISGLADRRPSQLGEGPKFTSLDPPERCRPRGS